MFILEKNLLLVKSSLPQTAEYSFQDFRIAIGQTPKLGKKTHLFNIGQQVSA
jgi:hypothetical protein